MKKGEMRKIIYFPMEEINNFDVFNGKFGILNLMSMTMST